MTGERPRSRARRPGEPGRCRRGLLLVFWLPAFLLIASPASSDNRIFVAEPGRTVPVEPLPVRSGESFTLDLRMDLLDRTVGGGVLVRYDHGLLRLDGVRFNGALGDDPSLRCPASPGAEGSVSCPSDTDVISFGSVETLRGAGRVASLDFSAIATGTALIGVSSAHPFSDVRGGALVVTTVPEPRARRLVYAALLTLLVMARWRSTARRRVSAFEVEEVLQSTDAVLLQVPCRSEGPVRNGCA